MFNFTYCVIPKSRDFYLICSLLHPHYLVLAHSNSLLNILGVLIIRLVRNYSISNYK